MLRPLSPIHWLTSMPHTLVDQHVAVDHFRRQACLIPHLQSLQNTAIVLLRQSINQDVTSVIAHHLGVGRCAGESNEQFLFHGAARATIATITREGFDIRVSNLSGALGAGTYFAFSSAYSHSYSSQQVSRAVGAATAAGYGAGAGVSFSALPPFAAGAKVVQLPMPSARPANVARAPYRGKHQRSTAKGKGAQHR